MDKNRVDFKLLPVYDLRAVNNTWAYYIEGIENVLTYSTGEINLTTIYNDLMAQELLLWVGFIDNKYCGFLTTKTVEYPFGERELKIFCLYIKTEFSKDVFLKGMRKVRSFAKKMNCSSVRFWSLREKGFSKKMIPLGWELGYQEYIYRIKPLEREKEGRGKDE